MNIGLLANDSKKKLMQNFCVAYRNILTKHHLFATGTTGRLIEEVTHLSIHKYLSGPMGGAEQLIAQIDSNEIDLVIYLQDPNKPVNHTEPSVSSVVKSCDMNNIPIATNLATAELLILAMERGDFEFREAYR